MYLEMVYFFVTYYPYRYETLACQVVGDCLARVLKKEKKTYQFFFFYNLLFRTLITILMCTVFALSASIVVMHAGGKKRFTKQASTFVSLPVWSFSQAQAVDLKEFLNY